MISEAATAGYLSNLTLTKAFLRISKSFKPVEEAVKLTVPAPVISNNTYIAYTHSISVTSHGFALTIYAPKI